MDIEQEVLINENGTPVNYIVVHQGLPSSLYDASCDGTWLLRKDIKENGQWNSSNVNTLAGSTIMTTMAGYVNEYDPRIQAAIKTVKIPYCVGGGNTTIMSGANGLECKVFPLGGYEVGFTTSVNQYFPVDGAKLDYFLSGNDSSANQQARCEAERKRHPLVAPLPVHRRHRQRVARELRRRLQLLERQQFRRPPLHLHPPLYLCVSGE